MRVSSRWPAAESAQRTILLVGMLFAFTIFLQAEPPVAADAAQVASSAAGPANSCQPSILGSPYIPVDSWVYPAMMRLYSIGYVNMVYLGLRPWTR